MMSKYAAGMTNMESSGAVIMPPIMGAAIRCMTSAPLPSDHMMGIRPATMAHIHRGAVGVAGPIVVTLNPPTRGMSNGCVRVGRRLAAAK